MQGGRGEATLAGVSVAQATQGRWEEAVQAAVEGLEMVSSSFTLFTVLRGRKRVSLTPLSTPRAEPFPPDHAGELCRPCEVLHPSAW